MMPRRSEVPDFPPPPRSPSPPPCPSPRNRPMPSPFARTLPVTIPRPSVCPGWAINLLRFEASASRNFASVMTSGTISLKGALLTSTSSRTTRGLSLTTSSILFRADSIFRSMASLASCSLGSYTFFVSGGLGFCRRFFGASGSLSKSTASISLSSWAI